MDQAIANDNCTAPDYNAIKHKQHKVWGAGDYGRIGMTLQVTGELLCEAMDMRAGESVLDVAAGNGNVSLAAARRFGMVISTDYVQALLNQAQNRANAEGLSIDFRKADAENLPFEGETFDNVVSTFGVMFTPNQRKAAKELVRVCKPGGKIGMANWTPDGFVGQLLRIVGTYAPPPVGVEPTVNWGTNDFLDRNFAQCSTIEINTRWFVFRYESPRHWLDVFAAYYGPVLKAFESLGSEMSQALQNDILELIATFNRADDGTMVVPSSYAEIVITK